MAREHCRECGRPLGYTMTEDGPGFMAILRGDAGEAARVGLILACCVLFVLLATGVESIIR